MNDQKPQLEAVASNVALQAGFLPTPPTLWDKTRRISRRHPTMMVSLVIIAFIFFIALAAPLLFTDDPKRADPGIRLLPPSSEHWFGTDRLGRDVWSRTIYGSRISMIVGLGVAAVVGVFSTLTGLIAGYNRTFDSVYMRLMDGIMAIPTILVGIALVSITGSSVQNVIIALSLATVPRGVRVVRAAVMALAEEVYVEAAVSIGAPTWRVLLKHILPGVVAPFIVLVSIIIANSILVEALLSFLGAGTPLDVPSWGNMMAEGRTNLSMAMWVVGIPGAFLTVTVLAFNIIGDNLRDILDPTLSRAGK